MTLDSHHWKPGKTSVVVILLLLAFIVGIIVQEQTLTGHVVHEEIVEEVEIVSTGPLLDEDDPGFDSKTRGENYEQLLDALYAERRVVTTIDDKLWVPWYTRSDSCSVSDLHSGSGCNSGDTIDETHHCMVTDELSQVGVLLGMSDNQTRIDEYYNTIVEIESDNGVIPAWRIYRDGDTIEPCRAGINGNCDTASDATARIIISLFTASNNTAFSAASRSTYKSKAIELTDDMIEYEMEKTCRPSSLGHGDICYWLAAGSEAKEGGLASTDFGYSGYYADAIIALLQACSQTRDQSYCTIANNVTLNYLEAAKWDGNTFTVPPGRSFRWTNLGGIPEPQCTNTCSPDQWDGADAPRAVSMCQARYYAELMNWTLPEMEEYCDTWGALHMNDPESAAYQYYQNGTASSAPVSGYLAQGLQSLFLLGGHNQALFDDALDDALDHYAPAVKTWDWQACFGIYNQAFSMRALGVGIGRDIDSFQPLQEAPQVQNPQSPQNISINTTPVVSEMNMTVNTSQLFAISVDNPSSLPYDIYWYVDDVQVGASNDTTYMFTPSTVRSYAVEVWANSSLNNETRQWTINSVAVVVNDSNESNETGDSEESYVNVTISSVDPNQATNISDNGSIVCSIALFNPSNLTTRIEWYLDGINQTGSENTTSYGYTANSGNLGEKIITVRAITQYATDEHNFSITVVAADNSSEEAPSEEEETPAQEDTLSSESSSSSSSGGGSGGGGGGGGGGAAFAAALARQSAEQEESSAQANPELVPGDSAPSANVPEPSTPQEVVQVFYEVSVQNTVSPMDVVDALRELLGGPQ